MTDLANSIDEKAAEEYFRKANDAEKDGNRDKAMEFLERALNENPDHEAACFALALLYDRRGEDAKAIELYERISTSEPVHVNALMNLAVLYEDNNMYDDAARCLQAVLLTDPNHARARLYLKDVNSASALYLDDSGDGRGPGRAAAMEIPISDFELSVRSRNCLKKMNIHTLGELLRVGEAELLAFKNFGETSLNEIKSLLASKGLRLGQNAEGGAAAAVLATPAGVTGGGLSPVRRSPVVSGDIPAEIGAKSVADMELSVRSRKALQRLNIQTIGELASRTEEELLGCKNFGATSLTEIKQVLTTFGLGLRKLDS